MLSPYAEPNSPIASAKRSHHNEVVKEREVNSPLRKLRRHDDYNDSCDDVDSDDYEITLCDTPGVLCTRNGPQESIEASINEEAEESDGEDSAEEFDAYLFMYTLPPYFSTTIPGKVLLPPGPRHHRITLVLDLDETLVHCSVNPVEKFDFKFPVAFNAVDYEVYVRKRPYVDYFLEAVAKDFEVVLFTASQSVYADKLLNLLDPDGRVFSGRLFREACLDVNGNFVKDLGVLNRDLSRTVLVDNSPYAYGYHIDNGIPIESWFDDDGDTELLKLLSFLRRLTATADVRQIVRDHFKTHKLVENAGNCALYDK